VKYIKSLSFMIHGFCYAADTRSPYGQRERVCAAKWYARLEAFPKDAALAIIPAGREGPAADYYTAAESTLGDRCFMLDAPDCHQPEFWAEGDPNGTVLSEIRTALLHQRMAWNKEELFDALHVQACCRQLRAQIKERGFNLDSSTLTVDAWGESFDGCVTKYSLNLRRVLGVTQVVGIDFDLTVPDASFLLDASLCDCVLLDSGLRLFVFARGDQFIGLYTRTSHSLADAPAYVTLPVDAETTTVKSKQGIRLWPRPEAYVLRNVPAGYDEPAQTVVTFEKEGLRVPISAGVVYRLAKAPAYIFLPAGMPYADARSLLTSAHPCCDS
jgi:hypothetical protein